VIYSLWDLGLFAGCAVQDCLKIWRKLIKQQPTSFFNFFKVYPLANSLQLYLIFSNLLDKNLDPDVKIQYEENLKWVQEAGNHKLVVGSQARILYNDCVGRSRLATRFNELIKSGELKVGNIDSAINCYKICFYIGPRGHIEGSS
jgi:hypothetical protein